MYVFILISIWIVLWMLLQMFSIQENAQFPNEFSQSITTQNTPRHKIFGLEFMEKENLSLKDLYIAPIHKDDIDALQQYKDENPQQKTLREFLLENPSERNYIQKVVHSVMYSLKDHHSLPILHHSNQTTKNISVYGHSFGTILVPQEQGNLNHGDIKAYDIPIEVNVWRFWSPHKMEYPTRFDFSLPIGRLNHDVLYYIHLYFVRKELLGTKENEIQDLETQKKIATTSGKPTYILDKAEYQLGTTDYIYFNQLNSPDTIMNAQVNDIEQFIPHKENSGYYEFKSTEPSQSYQLDKRYITRAHSLKKELDEYTTEILKQNP